MLSLFDLTGYFIIKPSKENIMRALLIAVSIMSISAPVMAADFNYDPEGTVAKAAYAEPLAPVMKQGSDKMASMEPAAGMDSPSPVFAGKDTDLYSDPEGTVKISSLYN
jgi:hypothetical protein